MKKQSIYQIFRNIIIQRFGRPKYDEMKKYIGVKHLSQIKNFPFFYIHLMEEINETISDYKLNLLADKIDYDHSDRISISPSISK